MPKPWFFRLLKRPYRLFLLICMLYFCLSVPSAFAQLATAPTATALNRDGLFTLQPYKPSYSIVAYDSSLGDRNASLQPFEVQFQVSFKVPFAHIPYKNGEAAFGYTQVAYWQMFNTNYSSPFRETNYAPELMASFHDKPDVAGLEKISTVFGFIHESNGRGMPDSRSWNRIYADAGLEWKQFSLGVKPWYRLKEKSKESPDATRGDDNPDILRYLGYGELYAKYHADPWALKLTARNNLRSHPNYGSLQADLTWTMKNDVKLYAMCFRGYGESLIDYNISTTRCGFGVLLDRLP